MEFLQQIASSGLLGVLLAYTLWDNRELRKKNEELQNLRVTDAQSTVKGVVDPLEKISDALNEQKTMFNMAFGRSKND